MTRNRLRRAPILVAAVMGLGMLAREARADAPLYLSLGDSTAFGASDASSGPSYGIRGYVGTYAQVLAGLDGGVAPQVTNLALPGETSTSFFSGAGRTAVLPGSTDAGLAAANLNYNGDSLLTQQVMMISAIEHAIGNGQAVSNVTLALGSGDLLALSLRQGFVTESPAAQQADFQAALATFQTNEMRLVNELRMLLPTTNLTLIGASNVVPPSMTSSLLPGAIASMNQLIAADAASAGANYVSVFAPIPTVGAGTVTLAGGLSPVPVPPTGLTPMAVPEPSSILLILIGGAGLVAARRSRPSRRPAASDV